MSPRLPARLLGAQSDRRLVELAGTGHERAFEVLVLRYRRQLLRYCGRMGLSDSRSEDVLQHSLLRAWLALERGTEVRELRPWLYRIVHNTAVNVMRSAREDHGPLIDAAQLGSAPAPEHDFERRMAVRDALSDVAELPPMQRDAILLTALDGRSHEEVASALGITHGAVRGLLYRARSTLRSAAAALTPQPLISWACGCADRVTPTAQKLAELSAQGGGGMGGALAKGTAMAVTAAVLVAGAAEVPLPSGGAHRPRATADRQSRPAPSASEELALSSQRGAQDGASGGRLRAEVRFGHRGGSATRTGLALSRRSAGASVESMPSAGTPAHRVASGRDGSGQTHAGSDTAGTVVKDGSSGGSAQQKHDGSGAEGTTGSGSSGSDGSGGGSTSGGSQTSGGLESSSGKDGSGSGSGTDGSSGDESAQVASLSDGSGKDGTDTSATEPSIEPQAPEPS
jgi:RNA polymerase sigma factor (sigma-70 family)